MNNSDNMTMMEAFEWYTPSDQKHWRRLRILVPSLKAIGIDNMWIPPACKAGGCNSNGYDTYDLYDIGEFEQKGSRGTKWGTKEELVDLVETANAHSMGIYWDAVLNHKACADYSERCQAVKVDPANRLKEIGVPQEIEAWLGFNYDSRENRYSSMKYNKTHFSGTDFDSITGSKAVYKLTGEGKMGWANDVDAENGNADYLMFADVDFSQPDVKEDICRWGEWLGKELKISGIRFDAVKHFSAGFLKDFVNHLDQTVGSDWFFVGEYCVNDVKILRKYIEKLEGRVSLFDFKLHENLVNISRDTKGDLTKIYDDTLTLEIPEKSVTFIANHDTQEREQEFESTVAPYFLLMAYALILLDARGYPCVFYGDLFGVCGPQHEKPENALQLSKLILARKLYAYGPQKAYFDQPHCIGFTRSGDPSHSQNAGVAIVMTNATDYCWKRMHVGESHAKENWTDMLCYAWGKVVIDDDGWGNFPVGPRKLGVWIHEAAEGRSAIDELTFDENIYDLPL